jgi:hypothetical protein
MPVFLLALVAVIIGLEGSGYGKTKIIGLFFCQS